MYMTACVFYLLSGNAPEGVKPLAEDVVYVIYPFIGSGLDHVVYRKRASPGIFLLHSLE